MVGLIAGLEFFCDFGELVGTARITISDFLYSNQIWLLLGDLLWKKLAKRSKVSDATRSERAATATYKLRNHLLPLVPVSVVVPDIVRHYPFGVWLKTPFALGAGHKKRCVRGFFGIPR